MQEIARSYDIPDLVERMPGTPAYLGEVLLWVASRISPDAASIVTKWDQAEAELIEKCATGELVAKGALEEDSKRKTVAIPVEDWRAGLGNGDRSLTITTVDTSIGTELGGVVSISCPTSIAAQTEWVSVHIPAEQVLKAWANLLSPEEYAKLRRREILDAVRVGELSPDAAELHARAADIGPLARKPNDSDFDPFKEPLWSFEMALAWIMRRTADSVREYWADYQKGVWQWVETVGIEERDGKRTWVKGFELQQGRLPGFILQHSVAFEDARRADGRVTTPRALHDYEDARAELFAKLSSGGIIGTARIEGGANRFDLLPAEWEDIRIPLASPAQGNDRLRLFRKSGVELLEVLFPSEQVVRLWPSPHPSDEGQTAGTVRAARSGRTRNRDAQDKLRVEPFLKTLFADGIPDRSQMTGTQLVAIVAKAMDDAAKADPAKNGPAPSRDTILRAAGRK